MTRKEYLVSDNIYKTPEALEPSESDSRPIKRGLSARFMFSVLWFFPIFILVVGVIGGVVGLMYSSPEGNTYTDGYEAGKQAGAQLMIEYGLCVRLVGVAIWAALCFFGKLPGTSKFKKVKS